MLQDANLNEQSVIFNEEMVGGQEKVTMYEKLNTDQAVKIAS